MNYKNFAFGCTFLGLTLMSAVCTATVPEDTEEAAVTKASQTITANKNDKQILAKKRRDVQVSVDKNKLVVSNKPAAAGSPDAIKGQSVKKQPSLLQERNGKFYFADTQLPDDYRSISIFGAPVVTKAQAVAYIKLVNPNAKLSCSVEELVDCYWQEAERENVRPDLALAQSLVETGTYYYGGDVLHHQNNFCGLGTTGGGVRGAAFATPQLGVRAHIQHLLAYARKEQPVTEIIDPRYDLAHNLRLGRGLIDVWYGLNGTWAMGSLYCEKIMATYQKLLAQQAAEPVAEKQPVKAKQKKQEQKKTSMKKRVEQILQGKE